MLYDKDKTVLLCCPGGKAGTVRIPDGVTRIEDYACSDCYDLVGVILPEGMASIGEYAFNMCFRLVDEITLPYSITDVKNNSFYGCQNLARIHVEKSNPCYSSVDGVLYNKDRKVLVCCPVWKTGTFSIPEGVVSIGDQAFFCCRKLTAIAFPESVIDVGTKAFCYCSDLISIDVAGSNQNYSSMDGVLYSRDGTVLVYCPEGKEGTFCVPDGVRCIGEEAFGNSNLSSVILPAGVESIGAQAFGNYANIAQVFFLGDSPSECGEDAFDSSGSMAIYYIEGMQGWTNPWNGYTAQAFDPDMSHGILYDANGAQDGKPPADSGLYAFGGAVTILDNEGGLVRDGYAFSGWNTAPDGTGTSYGEGAALIMTDADVTLYADWVLEDPPVASAESGAEQTAVWTIVGIVAVLVFAGGGLLYQRRKKKK